MGKETYSIWILVCGPILTSISKRSTQSKCTVVVWDTQTGVVIGGASTGIAEKIVFHGDQRTITLVEFSQTLQLSVYDILDGTQLCQGEIPHLCNPRLGAHWVYKDILYLSIDPKTKGMPVINIYTFQPTSTPQIHTISSFPVQPYGGAFSFSPVSFHASYFTGTKITILNVQDSRLLLQAQVDQAPLPLLAGQFSPDGNFFACRTSGWDLGIWWNTPTGYISWGSLRPRFCPREFSWSPTSTSVLCRCFLGIQLLCLENITSPPSPNRNEVDSQGEFNLVAYSTDSAYIAMAREDGHAVTVLDLLSGSSQQFIDTDIAIHDIKIVHGTVFAVGMYKLVGWDLKAEKIPYATHHARVDAELLIGVFVGKLILSYDCSQIAFVRGAEVFLYDISAQRVLKSIKWELGIDLRFSPDMCQLMCVKRHHPSGYCLVRLEIEEDWGSVQTTSWGLQGGWSWVNLFSSCEYYIGHGSQWVVNSRGNKLLWLPPNWRALTIEEVRWEGNFLALLGGRGPMPVIIEFQPLHLDSSPSFMSTSFAKYVIPLSQHLHPYGVCSFWKHLYPYQ